MKTMWSRFRAARKRDVASPALLGVDVGFSAKGKTTGLAWFANSAIETVVVGSSWRERSRVLPQGVTFSLAALDAPVVPHENYNAARGCENVFYGGAFWNRCRPGLSHHGRGSLLKEAGREAARDFANVLRKQKLSFGPSVHLKIPIIEAFPNTFLGVLLPEEHFAKWSKALGKPKSDWLYEQVAEAGLFKKLLTNVACGSPAIQRKFEGAHHHDERAALICLLTAMFAQNGNAVIVGDDEGGWFWLPPLELWDRWAIAALAVALKRVSEKRFPTVRHWNGRGT